MQWMQLRKDDPTSLDRLAEAVGCCVSGSTVEYVLVIQPGGAAVLLAAYGWHGQIIRRKKPEQCVGMFSTRDDVGRIRQQIRCWMAAGGQGQTSLPTMVAGGSECSRGSQSRNPVDAAARSRP